MTRPMPRPWPRSPTWRCAKPSSKAATVAGAVQFVSVPLQMPIVPGPWRSSRRSGRASWSCCSSRRSHCARPISDLASLVCLDDGRPGVATATHQGMGGTAALTEPLTDWLIARPAVRWRDGGPRACRGCTWRCRCVAPAAAWSDLARRLEGIWQAADARRTGSSSRSTRRCCWRSSAAGQGAGRDLARLGVRVAVGNYGRGATSLAILHELPPTR